jgi:hypothetical protein
MLIYLSNVGAFHLPDCVSFSNPNFFTRPQVCLIILHYVEHFFNIFESAPEDESCGKDVRQNEIEIKSNLHDVRNQGNRKGLTIVTPQ